MVTDYGQLIIPVTTTLARLTIVLREHQNDYGTTHVASENERLIVSNAVIESARLFALLHYGHGHGMLVAAAVHNQLDAMSIDEWWAHEFVIHPTVCAFIEHWRLAA